MGINFKLLRKKFNEEQERLHEQYVKAGMTEEQIQAMYEFDLYQFNRDIAYYRHTQPLEISEEMDEGHNPMLQKFFAQLTVLQRTDETNHLWWLEEIEDEILYHNLMKLSASDLELVNKLAFCGYSKKEISAEYCVSPAAITLKFKTIQKNLKKS